jgi:hypothetical protein
LDQIRRKRPAKGIVAPINNGTPAVNKNKKIVQLKKPEVKNAAKDASRNPPFIPASK